MIEREITEDKFVDSSYDPEVWPYYSHCRGFGEIIMNPKLKKKLVSYFKPVSRPRPPLLHIQQMMSISLGLEINMEEDQSYSFSE
jgi:hypothetical protein